MTLERLGVIDEGYLLVEDANTPLHVASIGLFERRGLCDDEGVLRLDAIRRRIDSRLDLLPRLRQRVATVPFGVARPVWVDDDRFDIRNHVDAVTLPAPADEQSLLRLAEHVLMRPLDRRHPLWHLQFITGLDGDRVALVERAHHAMVDGVSGVELSLVLLDTEPDADGGGDGHDRTGADADGAPDGWRPQPTPTAARLLLDGIRERWQAPAEAVARVARRLRDPGELVHDLSELGRAVDTIRRSGVRAPHSSLNRPIGASRRIEIVRERLETVRSVGKAADATVNDVILAAVAGGLRELFLARGETIPPDRTVKVLVPVSVRADAESMALGNRVGGLFATLPVGIGDPVARLHAVHENIAALKASDEAAAADQLVHAADLLPPALAHVVQRGASHQPLVNLVVTNIAGPGFPLYAMGARMLEAFPVVPIGAQMTLGVAVLSYDGTLNIGITADRDACPDVGRFAHGLQQGFEELHASWAHAV